MTRRVLLAITFTVAVALVVAGVHHLAYLTLRSLP